MNVVYLSQFRDASGYAVAARGYLKALDTFIENNPGKLNLKVHTVAVDTVSHLSTSEQALLEKYEFRSESEIDNFVSNDYILLWHQPAPMITWGDHFEDQSPVFSGMKKLVDNANKNINIRSEFFYSRIY